MELIAKTGIYTLKEKDERTTHLEVYRLSKDFVKHIEEDYVPTDEIMKELGFSNRHDFVEPGPVYLEYAFVALNQITGILVIEVQESLNV